MLLKTLLDRIAAAAGMVVLSPLFLFLAVAILVETGRPVFFRQNRVGRNGKLFRLVKFRSMRIGLKGTKITAGSDSRITPLGAVLRKYKLDELPQLWNVLSGDMSLVGPRPEVPEFVDLANPLWRKVLGVRPGLTDYATLVYRDEERELAGVSQPEVYYREVIVPAKLSLATKYIDSRSFWLDLKIILLTVYYSVFPSRFNADRVHDAISR